MTRDKDDKITKDKRQRRLEERLRENLKRRKEQARSRREAGREAPDDPNGPDATDDRA